MCICTRVVLPLVAGIPILGKPRILNHIVAAYLIIIGLIMLLDVRI